MTWNRIVRLHGSTPSVVPKGDRECRMLEHRYRRTRVQLHRLSRLGRFQFHIETIMSCIGSVGSWPVADLRRRSRRRCRLCLDAGLTVTSRVRRVTRRTDSLSSSPAKSSASVSTQPPPPIINSARSSFTSFRSCSVEVRKIVMLSVSLIKSWSLDYYNFHITGIHRWCIFCRSSLRQSTWLWRLSSACLAARLTKTRNCHVASEETMQAYIADTNNNRLRCPISNLSFKSTLIERVVANQLMNTCWQMICCRVFSRNCGIAIRQKPLCCESVRTCWWWRQTSGRTHVLQNNYNYRTIEQPATDTN